MMILPMYVHFMQVSALINTTNWLGVHWTPMTNTYSFDEYTSLKAKDCLDFHDLYLGGRYYLSSSTRSLTITQEKKFLFICHYRLFIILLAMLNVLIEVPV